MSKIRKATKNFLCEKCNNLIPINSTYFDWWNQDSSGKYYHRRFHTNCVCDNNRKENKVNDVKSTIIERLQKLLNSEKNNLLACNKGVKCYVCGIRYSDDSSISILCESWNDRKPYYESVENFKKYTDYNGNYF